ncbi:oxidoreductase [Variovorax sp. LjRoot290]|uniref:oxidoreductase n=1 Tax=Variovorax sp. LjRoot290 TaxID=3342316 RepID=UPI003ECED8C7
MSNSSKVWFITGASRGFGMEIARDALARGDRVVATARRPETIEAAIGIHDNLLPVALDVNNEEQVAAATAAAIGRFGRIDILVNNAGYGLLGAVEESSGVEVERLFATNVFGLLSVTRSVLPHMRRQRSGHLMNISSIGGYASYAGWGVYCATKFAVEALSESLSIELAPLGIHSTVVEPGFFRTDFLDASSLVKTEKEIKEYAATVGEMRVLMAGANHKQPGDPKKLSKAILVLADNPTPPQRLPLGTDTIAKLRGKNAFVEEELAKYEELATSTDHDDVRQ